MMVKDNIQAELIAVAEMIGNARAALMRNEIVEMRDIPGRMRDVANSITDLAPEEASEMRPPLVKLLADFKEFAEELKSKIDEIEATNRAGGHVAATEQSRG